MLPDVRAIRKNVNLSRTEFATIIGVSVDLVRSWELQRRTPSGAALKILQLIEIESDTDVIDRLRALHQKNTSAV